MCLQAELYTHHTMVRDLLDRLDKEGLQLCSVFLCETHLANDPGAPNIKYFMPTVALNICCPRDPVSRTAYVERNGGHKWVNAPPAFRQQFIS